MTPSRRRRRPVPVVFGFWLGSFVCGMGATPVAAAGPTDTAAESGAVDSRPVDVYTAPVEVRSSVVPSTPLTGQRLAERLASNVPGATWANVPMRSAVRQLAEGYDVAVMIDRRLDPTTTVSLDVANRPLREVVAAIAATAGGELRVVGNVVWLGPAEAADIVRTLAELRRRELAAKPGRRQAESQKSRTVDWIDLTEPVAVANDVAGRFDLQIANPEAIPHDLWAGGVFPEMDAADMLTLLAISFDLTFEWTDDFRAVRFVPLPADRSDIGIERVYPSFRKLDETLAGWKDTAGPIATAPSGRNVVVRGPLELHELIDAIRPGRNGSGNGATMPGDDTSAGVIPLSRRQFTLSVSQVPALAIMQKLSESGIEFDYDEKALADAGVDLNQPVSIDVKQADAQAFLNAIFEPLGVKTTIRGVTVTLKPAGE